MTFVLVSVALSVAFVLFTMVRPRVTRMYHGRYWEDAVCTGLQPTTNLGQPVQAHFRRAATDPSHLEGATVTAELHCREWVRYQSGTRTVTKQEVVKRVPASVQMTPHATEMQADITVAVPEEGPATFSLDNNKVSWVLHVQLDSPSAPDPSHDYPLTVAPRLGAHHG